jgi:organic hydroperoxide reductase OsmC/OhrA
MQDFPHRYQASAVASGEFIRLDSPGLPSLETAAPAAFDGPGDRWSPETMFTGAIANCFILTFKSVARASKFDWIDITCDVDAVLHRVDRVTRFTVATLTAKLTIADEGKRDQAERVLRKSEESCLVRNSLKTEVTLLTAIETVAAAAD